MLRLKAKYLLKDTKETLQRLDFKRITSGSSLRPKTELLRYLILKRAAT